MTGRAGARITIERRVAARNGEALETPRLAPNTRTRNGPSSRFTLTLIPYRCSPPLPALCATSAVARCNRTFLQPCGLSHAAALGSPPCRGQIICCLAIVARRRQTTPCRTTSTLSLHRGFPRRRMPGARSCAEWWRRAEGATWSSPKGSLHVAGVREPARSSGRRPTGAWAGHSTQPTRRLQFTGRG